MLMSNGLPSLESDQREIPVIKTTGTCPAGVSIWNTSCKPVGAIQGIGHGMGWLFGHQTVMKSEGMQTFAIFYVGTSQYFTQNGQFSMKVIFLRWTFTWQTDQHWLTINFLGTTLLNWFLRKGRAGRLKFERICRLSALRPCGAPFKNFVPLVKETRDGGVQRDFGKENCD